MSIDAILSFSPGQFDCTVCQSLFDQHAPVVAHKLRTSQGYVDKLCHHLCLNCFESWKKSHCPTCRTDWTLNDQRKLPFGDKTLTLLYSLKNGEDDPSLWKTRMAALNALGVASNWETQIKALRLNKELENFLIDKGEEACKPLSLLNKDHFSNFSVDFTEWFLQQSANKQKAICLLPLAVILPMMTWFEKQNDESMLWLMSVLPSITSHNSTDPTRVQRVITTLIDYRTFLLCPTSLAAINTILRAKAEDPELFNNVSQYFLGTREEAQFSNTRRRIQDLKAAVSFGIGFSMTASISTVGSPVIATIAAMIMGEISAHICPDHFREARAFQMGSLTAFSCIHIRNMRWEPLIITGVVVAILVKLTSHTGR
ncbi:MAG: hypothetical protein S4CHLAM81_03950 [Chlamydiales bacterium]|nr:hypothetical protein [Chlamydiales bacterium]MCH9635184.1 hypothetical protein [Chlamydiales bacterium]MCH9704264.1 RING finger protein [Chlamydiota bacterium]